MDTTLQHRKRVVEKALRAYQNAQDQRVNVPIELAVFAIQNGSVPQCKTFLLAHFLFSGKSKISERPTKTIARHLSTTERTIYRHFEWLMERNWIGKDERNGWIFFRGIDRIRTIEGWKSKRATTLTIDQLNDLKGFLTASIIGSIGQTRNKTERRNITKGRSLPTYFELSLKTVQDLFNVSRSTTQNYLKRASKERYLHIIPNLKQIQVTAKELDRIRSTSNAYRAYSDVPCAYKLFGSTGTIDARPQQLRTHFGRVFVQLPNLMRSTVMMCNRSR